MIVKRKITKEVFVGNVGIGGAFPIAIQSMTKTKTSDAKATISQINQLSDAGADIVRVSVNDIDAVNSLTEIIEHSPIPIVADIHYNPVFALKSIEAGIHKIRINPGNIGDEVDIKKVLEAANKKNIPIRIGVNSGSLEKDILEKYNYPTPEALFESAVRHINIAQKYGFENLIIAVKSSSVVDTIEAYKLLSNETNYPLHIGLTEAGTSFGGLIKSSVAIGHLLISGIGDTIRVSLNADPIQEINAAKDLLKALCLRSEGVEIIACPRCGRSKIDTSTIIEELEEKVRCIKNKNIKVAVMACAVNGIGEAKNANIAIILTGTKSEKAMLYVDGEKKDAVSTDEIIPRMMLEIERYRTN